MVAAVVAVVLVGASLWCCRALSVISVLPSAASPACAAGPVCDVTVGCVLWRCSAVGVCLVDDGRAAVGGYCSVVVRAVCVSVVPALPAAALCVLKLLKIWFLACGRWTSCPLS